jgi:1,4-alpha-glucan branching enzyme
MKPETAHEDLAHHQQLITTFSHKNPHDYLGVHEEAGETIVRIYAPWIEKIGILLGNETNPCQKIEEGFFEYRPSKPLSYADYQIVYPDKRTGLDPYSFPVLSSQEAVDLFQKGENYQLYQLLGAHPKIFNGISGVLFTVWAPNAKAVYLIGDFNFWDGRVHPMREIYNAGIFELFLPNIANEEKYKFEIRTQQGHIRTKADPFGSYFEKRPKTSSIVYDSSSFCWEDTTWIQNRHLYSLHRPINIYEVHLGSWREGERFRSYKELAHELSEYVLQLGYTHIELLPITEHPLDESWGYQITGFFAPTSRYGTPDDFKYFINHMHKEGIGVILDWVPGHFPTDDHALSKFDGTFLFEYEDPHKGMHPHWHTAIFNYENRQVSNFLIASALYWLEVMHIDGLRVDAVASLLYLDFGRDKGKWSPNRHGGNHNLEAIAFIKHLNKAVHERNQGVLMIAEESSTYRGVTQPVDKDGLGFDLKWNMGWMHDTLRYFSTDPLFRKHEHNHLTFGLTYAFSEKFMTVFSHDEVVHEKKSLFGKMPGNEWEKFANLRTLICYMLTMPGKNCLFMGAELGQPTEWNVGGQLQWELLDQPMHKSLHHFFKEVNHFYLDHEALWKNDFEWKGFKWVDFSDIEQSVISFLRISDKETLLVVHNFTPVYRKEYFLKCENLREVKEIFNSDHSDFGGSNKCGETISIVRNESHAYGLSIHLAPLATMIFEVHFEG